VKRKIDYIGADLVKIIGKFTNQKNPLVLPHLKRCGLFVGFLGCSEKHEVAKQLPHPKGCGLVFLTLSTLFSTSVDQCLISDLIVSLIFCFELPDLPSKFFYMLRDTISP
jgi:hypothetical protein